MSTDPRKARREVKRRFRHPLHLVPGRFTRPGTAPGDLTGPPASEWIPTTLHLIDYSAEGYIEKADCSLEEAREYFTSPNTTWLHVNGTPSEELLRAVGDAFELHALALEDMLHLWQVAVAMGAKVTGVCSGRNADLVRSLGAVDVIENISVM